MANRIPLPGWTFAVILAGGVLTYYTVGSLLVESPFVPDLQRLISDPEAFVSGYSGAEVMAPLVLLLIPAVLLHARGIHYLGYSLPICKMIRPTLRRFTQAQPVPKPLKRC